VGGAGGGVGSREVMKKKKKRRRWASHESSEGGDDMDNDGDEDRDLVNFLALPSVYLPVTHSCAP